MTATTGSTSSKAHKEESVTTSQCTIEIHGKKVAFPFGEVQHVHSIAEYTIVEYARYVIRDVVADESPRFRAYVKAEMIRDPEGGEATGVVFHDVDEALVAAIAFKYQGTSSEAPLYFLRMIGAAAEI